MSNARWLALTFATVAVVGTFALPQGWAAVVAVVAVLALLGVTLRTGRDRPPTLAERFALEPVEAPEPTPRDAPGAWRAVLDMLPLGLVLLDDELTVLDANPAFARLMGNSINSMIDMSLIRATREYDLTAAVREGPTEPLDVQLTGGRHVRVQVAPLDPPLLAGRATLMLCIEDVTALHDAQRARTDLVANLSHELRTPISGARAIAETLQSASEDPSGRARFLDLLNEELERMSELVQRMLRLAQLESELEPLELEAVAPASLLETAAERFGPVAGRQDVRIEVEQAAGGFVSANPARAGEVLANLLDNALRHTPPGSRITLAAVAGDGVDGDAVRFEVRDEGPGILLQERDRVFERFYTGDVAREGGTHTGLGLAIARRLVQQQGGRIWVADRFPGATLCFTLARADGASAAERGEGAGDAPV